MTHCSGTVFTLCIVEKLLMFLVFGEDSTGQVFLDLETVSHDT